MHAWRPTPMSMLDLARRTSRPEAHSQQRGRWASPQPDRTDDRMHVMQVLALLLAASIAVNVAFATGVIARRAGASTAQATLTAAGAAGTVMALFLTAVIAYH